MLSLAHVTKPPRGREKAHMVLMDPEKMNDDDDDDVVDDDHNDEEEEAAQDTRDEPHRDIYHDEEDDRVMEKKRRRSGGRQRRRQARYVLRALLGCGDELPQDDRGRFASGLTAMVSSVKLYVVVSIGHYRLRFDAIQVNK